MAVLEQEPDQFSDPQDWMATLAVYQDDIDQVLVFQMI
jgi:hypothetical protein